MKMSTKLVAQLEDGFSSARLLEAVRERAAQVGSILWPNVQEGIAAFQVSRDWMSHLEIYRAITSGRIKDRYQAQKPENLWVITILGQDSEGEPLGVIVQLPTDQHEPLRIIEVFLTPPGFQLEAHEGWE